MLGKEWWLFIKKKQLQWQLFKRKNHFSDCKKKSDFFWLIWGSSIDNTATAIRWSENEEFLKRRFYRIPRGGNPCFSSSELLILWEQKKRYSLSSFTPMICTIISFWEYKNRQRKSYQSKVLNRNKAFVSKIQLSPLRAAIDCLNLKQNTIRTALGFTKNLKNKKT